MLPRDTSECFLFLVLFSTPYFICSCIYYISHGSANITYIITFFFTNKKYFFIIQIHYKMLFSGYKIKISTEECRKRWYFPWSKCNFRRKDKENWTPSGGPRLLYFRLKNAISVDISHGASLKFSFINPQEEQAKVDESKYLFEFVEICWKGHHQP